MKAQYFAMNNTVGWYMPRIGAEHPVSFSDQRLELLNKGVLYRMLVCSRSFVNIGQIRQVLFKGTHMHSFTESIDACRDVSLMCLAKRLS